MSINTKIKQQGFTIVELLIVIVVIGILAAITIVAYNGVQNRANTAAAQSAANVIVKKAEAANSIATGYPTAAAGFSANAESSLAGAGIALGTPSSSNGKNTIYYAYCSSGAGAIVGYWDFGAGNYTSTYRYLGTATSATTGCTALTVAAS